MGKKSHGGGEIPFFLKTVNKGPFMISYPEVYIVLFPGRGFKASYHVEFKDLWSILNRLIAWLDENNHPNLSLLSWRQFLLGEFRTVPSRTILVQCRIKYAIKIITPLMT